MGIVDQNTQTCISAEVLIFDTRKTGDGSDAVREAFGATMLGTKRQNHPSPPCGSASSTADPWLNLFEPVCQKGGDPDNEIFQGDDRMFLPHAVSQIMDYTNRTFLTDAQVNIVSTDKGGNDLTYMYDVGWAQPSKNTSINASAVDDARGTYTPENAERHAQQVVRFAHRVLFFSQRQRVRMKNYGGDKDGYDFDQVAPWFQSDNAANDQDKCSYPESFEGGAPNEKWWDTRLTRIHTNALDQSGPDLEIYNVIVNFQYTQHAGMVNSVDGFTGKRGIHAYYAKTDIKDSTWPTFPGINAVPSDDDDFDCRSSRTSGVNAGAIIGGLVGTAFAVFTGGYSILWGAAIGAAYGAADGSLNDEAFSENFMQVVFGVDYHALSSEKQVKYLTDYSKLKNGEKKDCQPSQGDDCWSDPGCCKEKPDDVSRCKADTTLEERVKSGCIVKVLDCEAGCKSNELPSKQWLRTMRKKDDLKTPVPKFNGCAVPGSNFLRNVNKGGQTPQYFHDFDLANIRVMSVEYTDWDWDSDDHYKCSFEIGDNMDKGWSFDEEGTMFNWFHCVDGGEDGKDTNAKSHDQGTDIWIKLVRDYYYI